MISHTLKYAFLLSASVGALLSGCTTAQPALDGQIDSLLGNAVRANVMAHAVIPSDEQKNNTYIPADPARAALALKHYQEDTVEQQDDITIDPS
jgi:hypothetical protein